MIATLKKIQAKKAAEEINGGFTLIELLIVIVVLGILAAVVVFSLGGVTSSSAVAACQADGATVNTAIAAYYADNAALPTTTTALTGTGGNLESWPNNTSHYYFALATDATSASNELFIASKANVTTVATNNVGTTTALKGDGYIQWNGASSCTTAGVS